MTNWQPIETAPRDGSWILLLGGHPDKLHDNIEFDYENDQTLVFESVQSCVVAFWNEAETSWRYTSYDSGVYGLWFNPTHWMPLPQPPQTGDRV